MARKCFYSFQYKPDNWRVSKIRNIGTIEGNKQLKITTGRQLQVEVIKKSKIGYQNKWLAEPVLLF